MHSTSSSLSDESVTNVYIHRKENHFKFNAEEECHADKNDGRRISEVKMD